jgi:hypothetical protein
MIKLLFHEVCRLRHDFVERWTQCSAELAPVVA